VRGISHELLGHRLRGAVVGLRVGTQGDALVSVVERLAGNDGGLRAHVDEAAHAGVPAGVEHVARALHVDALELLPGSPFAEPGRRVEGQLAALGALAHRGDVLQVAAHGLGTGVGHLGGRFLGARQGAHAVASLHEAADQGLTDEARAAGHERGSCGRIHD